MQHSLYRYDLVTAPTEDPLDLLQAKSHCKIEMTDDDERVQFFIKAVANAVETITNRALITQTWKGWMREFPHCAIKLPKPKLASVTYIKYLDAAGAQQTLATSEYFVDEEYGVGMINPAYGKYWPSVNCRDQAVEIQFVAGYGAAKAVPPALQQAMHFLVGHFYAQREPVNIGNIVDEIDLTFGYLLFPYRILNV